MTRSTFARTAQRVLAAGSITAAMCAFGGAASAAPLEHGTFSFPYGPEIFFCGEQPFEVEGFAEGRFLINTRGPDLVAYEVDTGSATETVTNPETGAFVTADYVTQNGQHLEITFYGDGTYTFVIQFKGTTVMQDEDGTRIAHSAGLYRFSLTFDDAGTPGDPGDDTFIGQVNLLNAGVGFDYCAAVIQAIG